MKKISLIAVLGLLASNANALEYSVNRWNLELDADGMIGFLEPKNEKPLFVDDWDVKGQISYSLNNRQRIGAVYSIDSECIEEDEYVHDAFLLFEDKTVGRAEIGLTYSIARKMGLGLPDVGFLRINEKSILYKKLDLNKTLISDTTATTGHDALRLNLATAYTKYGQYGISIAGPGADYDFSMDIAAKYKQPFGKLKAAYSFAVSYMDNPDGYEENSYTPLVTADWRGQVAMGLNLQYNSFIFGTSVRMIYDEKPIGKNSDGLVAGTGVSYDLLQSSISLNYLFSDTNLWNHKDEITGEKMSGDYMHTILASFRYKYTEYTSLSMSGGLADTTPFFSVGIRTGF